MLQRAVDFDHRLWPLARTLYETAPGDFDHKFGQALIVAAILLGGMMEEPNHDTTK